MSRLLLYRFIRNKPLSSYSIAHPSLRGPSVLSRPLSTTSTLSKNPKRPIGLKERLIGLIVKLTGRTVSFKPAAVDQVGGNFSLSKFFVFVALVAMTWGGLRARDYYNENNLSHLKSDRKTTRVRELGKAAIGGPFELTNGATGNQETQEILNNKWTFLYFGFNFCPDICPEELEKMSIAYELTKRAISEDPEKFKAVAPIQGLYVSIDPARDTPKEVDEYAKDFNKDFTGLGGTPEQVDHCAKQFRMYYAKAPVDEKFPNDYLVDHSIIIYLLSPDGELEKHFLKKKSAIEVALTTQRSMLAWDQTKAKKEQDERERLERKREWLDKKVTAGNLTKEQRDKLLQQESQTYPSAAINRIASRHNSDQNDTFKGLLTRKPDHEMISEGEIIKIDRKTGISKRYDIEGNLVEAKKGGETISL